MNELITNHKMKLIIGAIIIILVVIGMCFYRNGENKKKQYEVEEVSSFQYYALYEEGKMGIIDAKGNLLIKPKYDNVRIPNPEKTVFFCQEGDKLIVLNDRNETLFSDFEEVTPIDLKGTATNIPYEKRVLRYKEDGKYGLIDYDGKKITKPIYEEIEGLENKESELRIKQNGKYGVINQKGATLIKAEYDEVIADGYYNSQVQYGKSGYIVTLKTR